MADLRTTFLIGFFGRGIVWNARGFQSDALVCKLMCGLFGVVWCDVAFCVPKLCQNGCVPKWCFWLCSKVILLPCSWDMFAYIHAHTYNTPIYTSININKYIYIYTHFFSFFFSLCILHGSEQRSMQKKQFWLMGICGPGRLPEYVFSVYKPRVIKSHLRDIYNELCKPDGEWTTNDAWEGLCLADLPS